MGLFTRTEMCMNCAGSGECPDCKGNGYNADGFDHMIHAFGGDDIPCDNCNTSGQCPDCNGEGEFEFDEDENEE